jgi:hypothetical protein
LQVEPEQVQQQHVGLRHCFHQPLSPPGCRRCAVAPSAYCLRSCDRRLHRPPPSLCLHARHAPARVRVLRLHHRRHVRRGWRTMQDERLNQPRR